MGVETPKSNLGQLVNVSISRGSHRAGYCDRRSITGQGVRKGTGNSLSSSLSLFTAFPSCPSPPHPSYRKSSPLKQEVFSSPIQNNRSSTMGRACMCMNPDLQTNTCSSASPYCKIIQSGLPAGLIRPKAGNLHSRHN